MRRVWRSLRDDESGFGLVESVVALLLAGIVFGALATSLVAAVQASLFGRQNQQATDFMTRQIERLRTQGFGGLALAAVPSGDPRLSPCGATVCLTVDGVPEPLVVAPGGEVEHTTVLTDISTNNTDYTITTYITEVPGEPVGQVRRATVYVSWQNRGVERTREISTLIAFSQRGLPLPVFRLEAIDPPLNVNADSMVAFELMLTNQGAPDQFNITLSSPVSGWELWADSDDDGDFDPTVDTHALVDTSLDGVPDTGRLDPTTAFRFFLVRDVPATETLGTRTTTVTATSAGQPTAPGGTKQVEVTYVVVSGPVTPPGPTGPPPTAEITCAPPTVETVSPVSGFTTRQFTLQHEGLGPSDLQAQMYLGFGGPDESQLWPYTVNINATATGRVLAPVGSIHPDASSVVGSSQTSKFADWAKQFSKNGSISGQSVVRLWVNTDGAAASLKVVLYRATGTGSGLSRSALTESVIVVPAGCAGFQEVQVRLPAVSASISKNQWIGIRVVVAGASNVRLGYDEPHQFPASFTIPVKGNI